MRKLIERMRAQEMALIASTAARMIIHYSCPLMIIRHTSCLFAGHCVFPTRRRMFPTQKKTGHQVALNRINWFNISENVFVLAIIIGGFFVPLFYFILRIGARVIFGQFIRPEWIRLPDGISWQPPYYGGWTR